MKSLMMFVLMGLVSTVAFAGTPYIQLSSAVDQANGPIYTEMVDGISGVSHEFTVGVIIDRPGTYMVVLAPQTGRGPGCSNYWVRVNALDIPNSNIQVCQTDAAQTTVAIAQTILRLSRDDVITFQMSGTLGIDATQPVDEPLIPSVIISVFGI